MGWNEPVFRGAPPPRLSHRKHAVPPQHLLTMGNSLSRAFRRASSSSGSLRACEEMAGEPRPSAPDAEKAQWHTQLTHLPASGSTNKPQPGASQRGGGRRRRLLPQGRPPSPTGRSWEAGGEVKHRSDHVTPLSKTLQLNPTALYKPVRMTDTFSQPVCQFPL